MKTTDEVQTVISDEAALLPSQTKNEKWRNFIKTEEAVAEVLTDNIFTNEQLDQAKIIYQRRLENFLTASEDLDPVNIYPHINTGNLHLLLL